MKKALMILLACVGILGAQQKPMTDEQLDVLGLQADVQRCQVNAEKAVRKLQKEIADLKAVKQTATDSKPDFKN